MIHRHHIYSALIVVALFALPVIAHSYSLIDLADETDVELEIDGQCSSVNIGNLVNTFESEKERDLTDRAKEEFQKSFQRYWQQWLMCIAGSILFAGGGVSGAKGCTTSVANSTLGAMLDDQIDNYKNQLITDCNAQQDIRDSLNAAKRVFAENGLDGGAVYVTNWRNFQADNRYRGLQIARNELANTKHCPWVSSRLQVLMHYDPNQAVTPMSGTDGQDSYISSAACSLPDDFNIDDPKYQTLEVFAAMLRPQNNIAGAYLMAQEEINKQIADEEQAGQNAFVSTGGMGPLYEQNPATGDGCAVRSADGSACLQAARITQPAAGVVAEYSAQRQALYDLVTNPRTESEVADDVVKNLVSSFLSMSQPLGKLQYARGGAGARRAGPTSPTPTPSPTNVPGSGDPGDPVCTGGNPACNCAINDTQAQQMARGTVLQATTSAIAKALLPFQDPPLVDIGGISVLPGMNVLFLQSVCAEGNLAAMGSCRASNSGFGLVLSDGNIEMNFDIILPSNVIRLPGVMTVVCTGTGNL